MREVVVEATGIRHEYPRTLSINVEQLEIGSGEILCLLGSSGAGKSTVLRILGLLESPQAGSVSINGKRADPRDLHARRRISAALQSAVMFRGDVEANVAYGLKLRGVGGPETSDKVKRALKAMDIEELRKRSVREISGGEAQRVAIARAIAVDSDVLLLDEPLAQVDEPKREALALELKRNVRERGGGVLWVTHDRAEALAIADRVAVMEGGELLQTGLPMEVFSQPKNERVARLVGTENIFHGRVVANPGGLATVQVGEVKFEATSEVEPGSEVLLLVRPEEISLATSEPVQASPRNRVRATIRDSVQLGAITKIFLDSPVPLVAMVTSPTYRELELRAGSIVWASFKATSVHMVKRT